ncbi:hypothetical protein [Arthrobacter sp. TWP1-1]|uniref:hypothetical protein n=1 Tax=Arthrobacter sp. TWP1-1 TaxID=2804568 RepID=UPI003CF3ACB7
MAFWQDAFYDWAPAWAAVQDQESEVAGNVVTIGAQRVMMWPGDADSSAASEASGSLVLVTEDVDGATHFAQSLGLRATRHQVLLNAETDTLDLVPDLPPDANLAEAPLENFDLVEVALFDRPVARGRLSLGDELAVLAELSVDDGHEELVHTLEQAMVAGLGEEAFTHGGDTLFLVASEEQAARFDAVEGWSRAAEILTFEK